MKQFKKKLSPCVLFLHVFFYLNTPNGVVAGPTEDAQNTSNLNGELSATIESNKDTPTAPGVRLLFQKSIYEKLPSKQTIRTLNLHGLKTNSQDLAEFIKKSQPSTNRTRLLLELFDPNLLKQNPHLKELLKNIKDSSSFDISILLSSLALSQEKRHKKVHHFEDAEAFLHALGEEGSGAIKNKKIGFFLAFHSNPSPKLTTPLTFIPFERVREERRALAHFLKKIIWFNGILRLQMYWILPSKEKMIQVKFEYSPISQEEEEKLRLLVKHPVSSYNCEDLLRNVLIKSIDDEDEKLSPWLGTYFLKNIVLTDPTSFEPYGET
jgi:hypothetical protein